MTDRQKIVDQVHQTAQMLAGGAIATPEHTLAAALIELTLALREKEDD